MTSDESQVSKIAAALLVAAFLAAGMQPAHATAVTFTGNYTVTPGTVTATGDTPPNPTIVYDLSHTNFSVGPVNVGSTSTTNFFSADPNPQSFIYCEGRGCANEYDGTISENLTIRLTLTDDGGTTVTPVVVNAVSKRPIPVRMTELTPFSFLAKPLPTQIRHT
jgi:hypothetical protein